MSVCHPDVDWSCLFTEAELIALREDPIEADRIETAEAFGWSLLSSLTAYQVASCPVTVRPCARRCRPESQTLAFPVGGGLTGALGFGSGSFNPHITGGSWVNSCGCRTDDCSCTELSEIILPGPVGGIVSVLQDGIQLPVTSYRVDNGNRLVRLDGEKWPVCQDMTKATSAPPAVAPVTLTWPNGQTLTLSRVGDIVTATATTVASLSGNFIDVPAEFEPVGTSSVAAVSAEGGVRLTIAGSASWQRFFPEPDSTFTFTYLAAPIPPVPQENTLAVLYYRGAAPNRMTRRAAGLLAADFYRGCAGDACALPDSVVSMSQQGTDYEFEATDFPDGVTGIKAVDAVIRMYNPYKRKSPTRIASPDAPLTRTPTWSR